MGPVMVRLAPLLEAVWSWRLENFGSLEEIVGATGFGQLAK
jgi:hypothetical protein